MLLYLIKYKQMIIKNVFLAQPEDDGVVVLDIRKLALHKRKAQQ